LDKFHWAKIKGQKFVGQKLRNKNSIEQKFLGQILRNKNYWAKF